jgi:hypothetical protein
MCRSNSLGLGMERFPQRLPLRLQQRAPQSYIQAFKVVFCLRLHLVRPRTFTELCLWTPGITVVLCFTDYTLDSFPTRPPPLGRNEAQGQGQGQGQSQSAGDQSTQVPPGYAQIPLPPQPGFNGDWRYANTGAPQSALTNFSADSGIMVLTPTSHPQEAVKERTRDEHIHYRYQRGEEAPSVVENGAVPVLLCHTCSVCGQMRSAGYHRNHPVVPGKPVVTKPCRKCKKRISRRSRATSYTRVRTCTADDPCDWPREPVYIEIDDSERRGRRKDRDEIYASWKTDHLNPYVIRENSSRANVGLRTVQRSPPRGHKTMTRERVSSLSPEVSRYEGVWPPPDVVRMAPSKPSTPFPASDEIWPPPDVVRTHSYRKQSSNRRSSRIVELSPSPPPTRSKTPTISYRARSEERRPRSPVRRSESHVRLKPHSRPYRTVVTDRRAYIESDDGSTNGASSDPVGHGILKPSDMTHETEYRRRTTLRDSQQSTNVEVGGPRVQFVPSERGRPHSSQKHDAATHERYSRSESYHYVDRPASPPIDRIERLHIRHSSPSPQRVINEIRVDRARRISPSPPRRYERMHERVCVRYVSVSPTRQASAPASRPPIPPPPSPPRERTLRSGYRHVSSATMGDRTHSLTPPPSQNHTVSEADVTDSEDEQGSLVEVRSWRGIDQNGQPATFVEERRRTRMIEQGSVGESEFRPLTERLQHSRSWRDV